MSPTNPLVQALDPALWERANRELLAKIITELTFEEVLHPEPLDPLGSAGENAGVDSAGNTSAAGSKAAEADNRGRSTFRLLMGDAGELRFTARLRHLGHRRVDPASLRWLSAVEDGADGADGGDDLPRAGCAPAAEHGEGGAPEVPRPCSPTAGLAGARDERRAVFAHAQDGAPAKTVPLPDVADLVAVMAPALGVDPSTTAGALAELANTLLSDVHQLAHGRSAHELVDLVEADPAVIEGEMRGHPWIVANKGRLGFDADDLAAYAPESQQMVRLLWLAAAPGRADAPTITGLDHHTVVRDQLGDDGWAELRERAATKGIDSDEATFVPVHPWQWRERIVAHHAADLAHGRLVPLGEMPARYRPQQSIRTLADADHPERRYLKLPLSILNTSVYRGLPRDRTLAAPALTEWFLAVTGADPFLRESGLVLLGEVASVSVAHPAFSKVPDVPYQHTEMLGAIWRDSVVPHLRPGERAVTLAALLHRDPHGTPFVAPLIERSGLDVGEWVDRLHRATLPPLVHVLYRFGATFSPHAQNCLVALDSGIPTRLVVKDFVDDAMISAEPLPELAGLPADVRRVLDGGLEAALLVQWIQGGLLVCVHRYLSELLDDHFGFPEARFWGSAERTLRAYQERFADDLADRFALFDLDAPAFVKLCLNRVRLFERGYADDPERPVASAVGWIDNPLALPEEEEAPVG